MFSVTVTEMVRVIRACRIRGSIVRTPWLSERNVIVNCVGTFHRAA